LKARVPVFNWLGVPETVSSLAGCNPKVGLGNIFQQLRATRQLAQEPFSTKELKKI
jgi:hypothetical protein